LVDFLELRETLGERGSNALTSTSIACGKLRTLSRWRNPVDLVLSNSRWAKYISSSLSSPISGSRLSRRTKKSIFIKPLDAAPPLNRYRELPDHPFGIGKDIIMNIKKSFCMLLLAALGGTHVGASAGDLAADTAVGAVVGAVIGGAIDGKDGALVGGLLGAAVGASGSSDYQSSGLYAPPLYAPPLMYVPPVVYTYPMPGYYPPPPMIYPPAPYFYQPTPIYVAPPVYHRGHRHDRRHDRRHDHGRRHGRH
jgi:hypothetical protein